MLDLAELGAREDGGDVIYEIKVPSPLYKKGLRGLGSPANGGCWAWSRRPSPPASCEQFHWTSRICMLIRSSTQMGAASSEVK